MLLVFFLSSFWAHAQTECPKLSKTDSIGITQTFESFIRAIENDEKDKILDFCLSDIDCIDCIDLDSTHSAKFMEEGYFVSKSEFCEKTLSTFLLSPVYKALKKKDFTSLVWLLIISTQKIYHKINGHDLTLYEVWIQTFSPNEWAEGHEGQSNAFQFVKIKNDFKLFGLTSVP